ncbi:MAG: EpsI family protein [bacterium]|nr:MAG: EpsI family protein [bacterium]
MKKQIKLIISVIILAACNALIYAQVFLTAGQPTQTNKEFSKQISDWITAEVNYDEQSLSILAADKIIYKSYQKNGRPPITMFIGYYNTLEKADLSHSPLVCFTGQGWRIENTTKKEIFIDFQDTPVIRVNQMIQTKLDTTMIALYWYQSAHRAFTNRGIQKLSLFFDKLLGKPDQNAFIRVTTIVPPEMSEEETTTHLFSFIKDMYPELRRFFL